MVSSVTVKHNPRRGGGGGLVPCGDMKKII